MPIIVVSREEYEAERRLIGELNKRISEIEGEIRSIEGEIERLRGIAERYESEWAGFIEKHPGMLIVSISEWRSERARLGGIARSIESWRSEYFRRLALRRWFK